MKKLMKDSRVIEDDKLPDAVLNAIYAHVAKELDAKQFDRGLWIRAEMESGGDRSTTRIAYTKLRVQVVVDAELSKRRKARDKEEEKEVAAAAARKIQDDIPRLEIPHFVSRLVATKARWISILVVSILGGLLILNANQPAPFALPTDVRQMPQTAALSEAATDKLKSARYWAEKGNVVAQFNLAYMHENGIGVQKDEVEAVRWYKKASAQGNAAAQLNLGALYAIGKGVQKDEVEAVRWYRKSADQGNAISQYLLGSMYAIGKGVQKDEVEAVRWLRKSADQEISDAQWNLGHMYADGRGVQIDDAEAVRWYKKAAEHGNAAAQYHLGARYTLGRGVQKDEVEADRWIRRAAEQGNVDAIRFLMFSQ